MKLSFFLSLCVLCGLCGKLITTQPTENTERKKEYDLVICAVFQDEAFFLKEWLEFHKLVGVQHFYLYDNLSTDNSLAILAPYIQAGEVDLIPWPVETHQQADYLNELQLPVYRHALEIVKETAHWAAFIDLDEFLFPVEKETLVEFLKAYESYPAVVVNWQKYGTSGVDCLAEGELLTEKLTLKAFTDTPSHHIIKSIVQPSFVYVIDDPHAFSFVAGLQAVNAEGEMMPAEGHDHPSIAIDKIRINHYWYGTREWFIDHKLPRRAKWGLKLSPEQIEAAIDLCNQEEDLSIKRLLPQLRLHIFSY